MFHIFFINYLLIYTDYYFTLLLYLCPLFYFITPFTFIYIVYGCKSY